MKIFAVDDDPITLALVAEVLRNAGHQVTTCASSHAALREITAAKPDCVITDIMMPEMDGFELIRELRRRPELAARAQVKRLHLFHHDPDQSDDDIDLKLDEARAALAKLGASVECDAPAEGADLVL